MTAPRPAIGASTYALQRQDVFAALPRLRRIGYQAVEVMAGRGWPTAPPLLNAQDRRRLAGTIRDLGFDPPAVMALLPLAQAGGRPELRAEFLAVCRLARGLRWTDGPAVVSSPLGAHDRPWAQDRERIAARLVELADAAHGLGVVLAVEPHVGNPLDSPEKAAWLMERTNHPALRLNLDVSHFHVQGMALAASLDRCLPYAAHLHVKDGRLDGRGRVVFQLPGEGSLDLCAYMRLLAQRRVDLPVIAEVSAMIWRRPDYDPWACAERAFAALHAARRQAAACV